ncbi:MAG: hypothetical protein H7145_10515 [Akkermansiaceae bacterium]|nr:hypothetical protein [Armatimonadota bacterium]
MSIRRKIFYGFTLAVLAVLLLLPATGWLARMQLFPFASSSVLHSLNASVLGAGEAGVVDAARFVATHPGDFDLQFAHAMNSGSEESLVRLAALDKQFPDNPAVIAARLTRMASQKVQVRRAEEDLLLPVSQRTKEPIEPKASSDPAAVAEFVAIAEQGERVAPTNAFFSCMVAVGNFARRHDAEATAAWKRAGSKPDWDDYALPEMNAKWKLQIARNGGGEVGFMPRTASSAAILFPHFTVVRAAARMATVKAFEAELAGNREEGIALRGATRRLGAVLMTRNQIAVGVLVGRAVTAIAMYRPGGAEDVDTPSYTQAERDANRSGKDREAKYVAYLQSAGHPEEAVAFAAASRDGEAVKTIIKDGMSRTYMGFGDKTFRLLACWYGDILLLAGVLSSLTFAGIFKLIYKFSPRLQKSEPLQTSARWGMMLGLALPCLVAIAALAAPVAPDIVCGGVLLAAALLLVVPPVACRLSGKSISHGLLVLLGTVGALAVIVSVGAVTWHMFAGPIGAVAMIQGLSGGDPEGDGGSGTKNIWGILLPVLLSSVMLSLPVVLLAAFAGFSRMLRIPVAAGVTRGMRAMAVPLACVLLLGWGVCLVSTLKHENAAVAEMKQIGRMGEPRLQAELLGRTYPAMTEGLRVP